MSGLPAVVTTEAPGAGSLTPVNQVKEASLTTERNLFEYLAQQSIANSLGNATTLANPAALTQQLSQHLRGFMERTGQTTDVTGKKKGRVMSETQGAQTAHASQSEGPQVHNGPARQNLTPSDPGGRRAEAAASGVSEREYDSLIDALTRSMHLAVESHAVVTGSSNIMKSANTLMRGQ
jgi:hypothetical protein